MIRPRRLTKVLIDVRRVSQSLLRRSLFRMVEHALGCSLFLPRRSILARAGERFVTGNRIKAGNAFRAVGSPNASSCALILREADIDDGACNV